MQSYTSDIHRMLLKLDSDRADPLGVRLLVSVTFSEREIPRDVKMIPDHLTIHRGHIKYNFCHLTVPALKLVALVMLVTIQNYLFQVEFKSLIEL